MVKNLEHGCGSKFVKVSNKLGFRDMVVRSWKKSFLGAPFIIIFSKLVHFDQLNVLRKL